VQVTLLLSVRLLLLHGLATGICSTQSGVIACACLIKTHTKAGAQTTLSVAMWRCCGSINALATQQCDRQRLLGRPDLLLTVSAFHVLCGFSLARVTLGARPFTSSTGAEAAGDKVAAVAAAATAGTAAAAVAAAAALAILVLEPANTHEGNQCSHTTQLSPRGCVQSHPGSQEPGQQHAPLDGVDPTVASLPACHLLCVLSEGTYTTSPWPVIRCSSCATALQSSTRARNEQLTFC